MENLDAQIKAIAERAADKTVDGNYALWNALLTMNTIMISVFTAGLIYLDRTIQLALLPLILLAMTSAAFLIANFKASRDLFKYQGILAAGRAARMSDEEQRSDLEKSRRNHTKMVFRERAVEIITILQGIVTTAIVVFLTFRDR